MSHGTNRQPEHTANEHKMLNAIPFSHQILNPNQLTLLILFVFQLTIGEKLKWKKKKLFPVVVLSVRNANVNFVCHQNSGKSENILQSHLGQSRYVIYLSFVLRVVDRKRLGCCQFPSSCIHDFYRCVCIAFAEPFFVNGATQSIAYKSQRGEQHRTTAHDLENIQIKFNRNGATSAAIRFLSFVFQFVKRDHVLPAAIVVGLSRRNSGHVSQFRLVAELFRAL